MNGWMDNWKDRRIDGWMDYGSMFGWIDGRAEV
jgi:hypothetical protein